MLLLWLVVFVVSNAFVGVDTLWFSIEFECRQNKCKVHNNQVHMSKQKKNVRTNQHSKTSHANIFITDELSVDWGAV